MSQQTPEQVKGHILGDLDALISSVKSQQKALDDAAFEADERLDEAALKAVSDANVALRIEVARLEALVDGEPDPEPDPEPPFNPEVPGWALQYGTTFQQPSDLLNWTLYNSQTQSNDNSVNMARNVTTGPGGLTIAGKRESGLSRPFSSGELVGATAATTVGNYFRCEVVGTFEDEIGVWPCLAWFRPKNASDGELDLMEWMGGMWTGDQKRVAITMHNEYGASQDSIKRPLILAQQPWFDPAKPHKYILEKIPGKITVTVDDRFTVTCGPADKSWWNRINEVSGRTWYPRITLQIGDGSKNSGGKKVVPDPLASWSSTEMGVSSFKLWRQA